MSSFDKYLVTIGKMKITIQSLIIVVVSTLVTMYSLYAFPRFRINILSLYLGMLINAYTVNCVVVGNCIHWSFAMTVLFVFILLFSMYLYGKTHDNSYLSNSMSSRRMSNSSKRIF